MYGAFNLLIPAMLSDNFPWRLLCLHCEVSMIIHGAYNLLITTMLSVCLFVCVEVLRPSQPNGVMSSAVSLPNHTFTGQA